MALANYTDLQTSIGRWLNRADLTSVLPDFIALAEASLRRDLRARGNVVRLAITLASGSQVYTLPADVLELNLLRLDTSSYRYPLTKITPEQLAFLRNGSPVASGNPTHYAVVDDEVLLYPTPSSNTAAEITYFQRLTSLSSGAPTNWLLTDAPDVYLYGSLLEAAPYLKDDARVELWNARFKAALQSLQQVFDRQTMGGVSSQQLPTVF